MWCVIPGAGRSTRLSAVARGRPKALLEVAGRPLIAHLLDRLPAAVTDVCVVAAPDGLDALRGLGERRGARSLHYAVQPEPVGVADAVNRASGLVRGPFLVVMGDGWYDRPLDDLVNRWMGAGVEGAVLVEAADSAGGQAMGLVRLSEGWITEIIKAPWAGETEWRVCGAYLLPESFFAAAAEVRPADSGEYELEDVVTRLLAGGDRFAGIPYAGWRRNINTPADLAAVERRIAGEAGSG